MNLARALIPPRLLLFLGEPTASLDPTSLDPAARAALVARLEALKGQGVTMIGVFHHPEDVAHRIERELVLRAPRSEVPLSEVPGGAA